jgi:hypothetical protein
METQRQEEQLYENKEGLTFTALGRSLVRIRSAVLKDCSARFLNPLLTVINHQFYKSTRIKRRVKMSFT